MVDHIGITEGIKLNVLLQVVPTLRVRLAFVHKRLHVRMNA
jgi:hypothetical protein